MAKSRAYSRYCAEALVLFGKRIKLKRKLLKWPEAELVDRAKISRATLQKIEKGDPTCAIGLFFEVATLVGIKLFESDSDPLSTQIERVEDKIALLPKSTHAKNLVVDDDF